MNKIKLALFRMRHLSTKIILLDFVFAVVLALLQNDPGIAIWFMFPIVLFGNFIGCWISVIREDKINGRTQL